MTNNEMYEYLAEYVGVSEETLNIITRINGDNEDTYNDILYAVCGYRDFEQYMGEQDKENYRKYFDNDDEDDEEEDF